MTEVRGVFKKRPNFLNSAPTKTEGSLWLLNAPIVRFWQQTAISPVSLWALVVELHQLNWALSQTVHRFSDSDNEGAWRTKCIYVYIYVYIYMCVCVCVCVCVWNFAANLVTILQRHFSCLTKSTGRTVWVERSNMSGSSVLKRAEYRSVKISSLDDFPHYQTTTMSREFALWFVEIVV